MKGYATTYRGMFSTPHDGCPAVERIEIPIMQRDYAQGRQDDKATAIRSDFLDALMRALTTSEPAHLDFVYGEVVDGVLKPLDGQQRLTTLFLLHWYVASRAGVLDQTEPWTRFEYSTRLSAEYFCQEIVAHRWPQDGSDPVEWIIDQPWFLFPWCSDPTIQSMLTMITSIHERLNGADHDFDALWRRLASPDAEAISFLFLPIDDIASADDLYIKMNSRGKPLTEFEIFKARLGKLLHNSGRQPELNEKIDRSWADLLWHYEGGNFLVDEEFMNYLAFIIDVCEWRAEPPLEWESDMHGSKPTLLRRAEKLFAAHGEGGELDESNQPLDFLFFAFDTWVGRNASDNIPEDFFLRIFSARSELGSGLVLFDPENPNLFEACLRHYGSKQFSLAETLLLFAVIIFRQQCPQGSDSLLIERLRHLRNLAESAPDEVRNEFMPELIASTIKLMTDPADTCLDGLKRFNQARVDDEKRKRALMALQPEIELALHALEDHALLRGRLFAFDLDPGTLAARGDAFREITAPDALPFLAPALLTKGDYSRRLRSRSQLGVLGRQRGGGSWRDVLTSGSRDARRALRIALNRLLEDVSEREGTAEEVLREIVTEWLEEQENVRQFGWRYYFVRYQIMLTAKQGIYQGLDGAAGFDGSYRVEMFNGRDYRSSFTDPFLLAIWTEVDRPDGVVKPVFWSSDYTGSEKAMKLRRSGIGIRSLDAGFEILLPDDHQQAYLARTALQRVGLGRENVVRVEQIGVAEGMTDAVDRIQVGVDIVRSLLHAGL